jgi:very-short-patch-repair endonuclease
MGSGAVSRALSAGSLVKVRPRVFSPIPLPAPGRHVVSGGLPDLGYLAQTRAVLLCVGSTAMAGGRTAAVLWGFDLLVEPRTIDVVWGESRRAVRLKGVSGRRMRGATSVDHHVLGLDPVAVLTPLLTVVDCALTRPLREAVVVADSALRSGAVTIKELRDVRARYSHHPRAARLRRVVSLADPNSGSVLETVLRVLLAQHGLHPESQATLMSRLNHFIGRVDFLFREQRLVIECDGRRWHDPHDARERDRIRDNELERAAWRLLRVTWSEVMHSPQHVIRLVKDCLEPWPMAA